ncbi:hypothetical protein L596_007631 [Steinernema carpocapsae]|uniref:Uncharacterized protein n=1 Tax=Steinernema carpocapsae TaxID=34508 RepID=A0A4V6A638_STECR|nr:hypothetical protein L596_007631 [Steinernema carpocapsae]
MRVHQKEYLPWVDTASLQVFVHSSDGAVFGESMRFQARAGGETSLTINQSSFKRLGGVYGECVLLPYYYTGE